MSINNQAVQNKRSLSSMRSSRGLMLLLDNFKCYGYFNFVNKIIPMVTKAITRLSKPRLENIHTQPHTPTRKLNKNERGT